jgi:hypothetical protein
VLKGAHNRFYRHGKSLSSPGALRRRKKDQRWVQLQLEELETRALLSASGLHADTIAAGPPDNRTAQPQLTIKPQQAPSGPIGFTPSQIQTAYGVSSLLNSGTTGKGETIAIVDAFNDPNIVSDVGAFNSQFSLQQFGTSDGPTLAVVTPSGSIISLGTDAGWAKETSLDVEWAHAIAPQANIVLVEATSDDLGDLLSAVQYATSSSVTSKYGPVAAVSMSWGGGEFWGENFYDSTFTAPGVTYVASSGDSGAWLGPSWPATSRNVLAVGGTTLQLTSADQYSSESGWDGSGGGFSWFEPAPSYQSNITLAQQYNSRTTPDVAFVADPNTGVAVYDTFQTSSSWQEVGGTSVGSPQWAAIVSLADQQRSSGLTTYQVQVTLYHALNNSATYQRNFHDITTGSNGYSAGPGYDLVTGLGSPIVNNIVPLLATTNVQNVGNTSASSGISLTTIGFLTAGRTTGGGLFTSGSSLTLAPAAPTAPANTAPMTPPISLPLTPPLGAPVGVLPGSVAELIPSTISLSTAMVPATPAAALNAVNASTSPSAAVTQGGTVFGATGWSGTSHSWQLSSQGLHGPTVEEVVDNLAGDLVGSAEQSSDVGPSGEDAPVPDAPVPMLIEGDAGDGGE